MKVNSQYDAVAIITDYGEDWKYEKFSITTESGGTARLELYDRLPDDIPWVFAGCKLPVIVQCENRVIEFDADIYKSHDGISNTGERYIDVELIGYSYTIYAPISSVEQSVAV